MFGKAPMSPFLKQIATAVVVLAALAQPVLAQSATCAPADSFATQVLDIVRGIADPADSLSAVVRSRLGISAVPDSEVVLVQTDSLCAAAGAALDAFQGVGPSSRELHVVKIGSSGYAVVDRRGVVNLFAIPFFSSSWAFKGFVSLEG
jgi:hypothetical protein